jgi:hypothetical protein
MLKIGDKVKLVSGKNLAHGESITMLESFKQNLVLTVSAIDRHKAIQVTGTTVSTGWWIGSKDVYLIKKPTVIIG